MNKRLKYCLQTLILLLTLPMWSLAQGPPPRRPGPLGPDSGPPDRMGPGPRHRPEPPFPLFEPFTNNKVVKGAPYSATAITESVQTLGDGAKITHTSSDNVYRDSEGRTRREQKLERVGPFFVEGEPRQIVFINDVVSGARIFLDPTRRTARKSQRPDGPPPRVAPTPPDAGARSVESLGKQMIEGVEAEGTRTTITILAGKIGNDRPLEIVSERWESPALQVVVLSKFKDPFAGETTYRLVNINSGEPSPSLFEIPSDYTIEEGKPDFPPPGARPKPPHKQE
jgi:hypothetical protein